MNIEYNKFISFVRKELDMLISGLSVVYSNLFMKNLFFYYLLIIIILKSLGMAD